MLPSAMAQNPAPQPPRVPGGVMVTTRAFINGKEVDPSDFRVELQSQLDKLHRNAAKMQPKAAPTPAPVVAPEPPPAPAPAPVVAPEPPAPAPAPAAAPEPPPAPVAPEPAPAPKPEAPKPCCDNPDCTCGPAPKPCECKPGATCGPKTAPKPAPATPAAAPAARPVKIVRIPVGKQASRPIHRGKPICSKCGKPRITPRPGDMPPCGKARPFGTPAHGTTPPCAHRHGKVVRPAVAPAPKPAPAAKAPQTIRVIINGVEAIVPLRPEGVNITIKPL